MKRFTLLSTICAMLFAVGCSYTDEQIDFADGWVHLRKSNTEPIIRVYSEAATMEHANALANQVMDVVKAHS